MKLLLLLLPLFVYAHKPALMLLGTYSDQNISGWIMSEKLDGIRAYWDGAHLLSRSGKIIHAPQWFTQNYPPFAVDGELWSGRHQFEKIASIVRDRHPSARWREITHYIFDVPHAEGTVTQRLLQAVPYESDHLKVLPQLPVTSKEHLHRFLQEIEAQGGEGVVVRNPNAAYSTQRSSQILKVKTFHDAECRIIGYNEGKGKYRGSLGSFTCKLDNNITFKIGSGLSDTLRHNPPPLGTIITFKYQEFTRYGKPRFPVFLRVKEAL